MARRGRIGHTRRIAWALLATASGAGIGPAEAASRRLLLEVRINNEATGLVATFEEADDKTLSATRDELLQLRLPVADRPDGVVALRSIPSLTYRYDERDQVLAITILPEELSVRRLDAGQIGDAEPVIDAPAGSGALLGYSLFAAASGDRGVHYTTGSALLDVRVYGPWGEVRQTGVVTHDGYGMHALRLDSTVLHADLARDLILRLGDAITGGPVWNNAARFAGVQLQHNFVTRPDLVTVPLPSIAGTAAVPSSLDLYIDGVRRYSTQVPAGRFEVNDLPAVVGGGTAKLVLRDVQGREVRSARPFYVSSQLLRPGLSAYSVEAGLVRRYYGVRSFNYAADPFVTASGRLGLAGPLTVEAHGEFSRRLALAGGGATLPIGAFGAVGGAASASTAHGRSGALLYLNLETGSSVLRVTVESRRTLGTYLDLAATSIPGRDPAIRDAAIPVVSDRATISLPLLGPLGSLSLSYAHERRRAGEPIRVASLFFSRMLFDRVSLTTTAFSDTARRGRSGLFAGLSMPLGSKATASTSFSRESGRATANLEAAQALASEPGSVGWRAAVGTGEQSFAAGRVEYQSRVATLRAELSANDGRRDGDVSAEGTVVFSNGSMFLTPHIGQSFALVDAKLPGVPILYENRPVGRTNAHGLVFVPDVRPFERNNFAVDEEKLPFGATVATGRIAAKPTGFNGARVTFAIERGETAALLSLGDGRGGDLPMGTVVSVNGGEDLVVGYDGLVLVRNLRSVNRLRVSGPGQTCEMSFAATLPLDPTAVIGPLACVQPAPTARMATR